MPGRASAKRYAQALFEIAAEQERVDQWTADLRLITEGLQNHELKIFLEHAKVPVPRKADTIAQVFQEADPMVQNMLSVLASRGLLDLVPEVEREYHHLVNELGGREQVEVSSAVPLEESEIRSIVRLLTSLIGKEVILESLVDTTILGGLVIKVGDRLIDGSTRTRLEELGKRLQRDSSGVGV